MKLTSKLCRDYAKQCHQLARTGPPAQNREFEQLASNWEGLACQLEIAEALLVKKRQALRKVG
jgi:hypothetical protein